MNKPDAGRRALVAGFLAAALAPVVRATAAMGHRESEAFRFELRCLGTKPTWRPPDRTRFALDRSAARRIGVEIPPEMLLRATDVVG